MAAVEVVVPAVCEPAFPIVETLQALNMSSQVDMPQVHENQDANSSDGEHGQVLDANARVYCAASSYGATSVYYCGGYNPPSAGWVEEHGGGIGYDAGRFYPVYGEDGSIVYYTSGYGYLQHCQQPSFCQQLPGAFVSGPAPGGHAYGPHAYPFPGPVYQHPVSPGIPYYSPPSFNSKQEYAKPGYQKPATSSYPMIPKHGYQGLLSPPPNGHYSWGGPIMAASSLHAQDGQECYESARPGVSSLGNPPPVPSREPVLDTSAGVQKTVFQRVPASSQCVQSTYQEPQASCTAALIPEARPKGNQILPKTGSNNSGRRVHVSSGFKSEKIKSTGCNLPAAEGVKQQGQVNMHINHPVVPADSSNDEGRRPQTVKCSGQQTVPQNCPNGHCESVANNPANREQYNKEDFQTRYSEARFFIIKSYSEDDVHKSIKYGVWSSTPNGNRRLDGAYREAQDTKQLFPVFLLFSVNTSGQFCGVAEMVGSVDYNKSMDFWLQGKWSGCFPVKWHIVKDVPNSQFRHIILANNDNKPVTHSRDTQEVKIQQGNEMLTLFKSFPLKTSILDDFSFYDDRQKVLEERKSKQRLNCQVVKALDQRSSDNKPCGCPSEVARGEDKENGKPGELQEVVSNILSSCGSDKVSDVKPNVDVNSKVLTERSDDILPITTDKRCNSKSNSGKDDSLDSLARSINYKRALMENVKGMVNVVGKPITV